MVLQEMARPERFELPTAWFVARYSIQLSYGRVFLMPLKRHAPVTNKGAWRAIITKKLA